MLKDAIQVPCREKEEMLLPSYELSKLQEWPSRQNVPTDGTVFSLETPVSDFNWDPLHNKCVL